MSAARLPTIPPLEAPPVRPKHLPPRPPQSESGVIVATHPREYPKVRDAREEALVILNETMARRGETNTSQAEHMDCPEAHMRAIRSGDQRKAFLAAHILSMTDSLGMAMCQALMQEIMTRAVRRRLDAVRAHRSR